MIKVVSTFTVPASKYGLLGTVGYKIASRSSGTTVTARSTVGVYVIGGGYGVELTDPAGELCVWDTGDASPKTATDDLTAKIAIARLTEFPLILDDAQTVIQTATSGIKVKTDLIGTNNGDSAAQQAAQVKIDLIGLGGNGNGSVLVNQDYGGADLLQAVLAGVPQPNVQIRAYVASQIAANIVDPLPPAAITNNDGRWPAGIYLSPGAYVLNYYNPATERTNIIPITVS